MTNLKCMLFARLSVFSLISALQIKQSLIKISMGSYDLRIVTVTVIA